VLQALSQNQQLSSSSTKPEDNLNERATASPQKPDAEHLGDSSPARQDELNDSQTANKLSNNSSDLQRLPSSENNVFPQKEVSDKSDCGEPRRGTILCPYIIFFYSALRNYIGATSSIAESTAFFLVDKARG
jgi:hypothetical protein